MTGKIGYTFTDISGEKSRVDINVATLTAGNIAATLAAADPGGAGNLGAAIAALSLCQAGSYDVLALQDAGVTTAPTDMYAQREIGLMVKYQDSVNNRLYRVTIPGPNWAVLGLAGTDSVNTAAAQWTAFVTAFEAIAVSQDGNAVTVVGGQLVGRNR